MRKLHSASRALWRAILQEFEQQAPPMTVRQCFYLCSVNGHVSKDEAGYRRVQYALLAMRRAGVLPYNYIADNTRWVRKGESFGDLSAALNSMHEFYRRDLWASLVQKTGITPLELGIVQRLKEAAPAKYAQFEAGNMSLNQAKNYLVQEGLL